MKSWTPGQVALLWIGGILAWFVANGALGWLDLSYGYTRAQLADIYLWRTLAFAALGSVLLGLTWRWLSVREK